MNIKQTLLLTILFLFVLSLYKKYNKKYPYSQSYINEPNYNIIVVPQFLTNEECDKIIQLTHNKLFPSKIYSESDDLLYTNSRQSDQCWLYDEDDELVKKISHKVREFTNTPNNYQEPLQIVKYQKGGFFTPHYDACEGNEDFCKRMNTPGGPRLYTMLFYLNDDLEGGETSFPLINKSIKPKKGTAILFKNVDDIGNIIRESKHGGNPVINGTKWIANKWIRIGNS